MEDSFWTAYREYIRSCLPQWRLGVLRRPPELRAVAGHVKLCPRADKTALRGRDSFWTAYREYIRSYLPQWRYDPESGEIESAVLLTTAEMIEDSRTRLARLPQKHELAFLRGWELAPLEAEPMCV